MSLFGHQIMIALAAASLVCGSVPGDVPDFGALSLDELANIKITSFTRKQQKLSQVAGAVYVITQEQIARSGLTSVPELLRLAPGVDVARLNGNQWSVSVRGPVGAYANKLLVLIDGRSIYSPVFSGVFWELGMPMLDDIERIEVIRGPGATIWGANAVLGVINIITKSSRDTHGSMVTAGGGSSERAFGSARMSGKVGSTSYRGYAGASDVAPLRQLSGEKANDSSHNVQGGFRLDGSYKKYTWMLKGDLFRAAENETALNVSFATQSIVESASRIDSLAGNITGEVRRRFGETGELRVSSYYDYASRPEPQIPKQATRTWDTEVQYDFTTGRIHNLSIGSGARLISEKIATERGVTFSPSQFNYANLNAFAQDEIHFAHDALLLTVGAKLERNHFGGWGSEPSANLLWMPGKDHSLWVSAARSLRTPSLYELALSGPFTVFPASAATGGLAIFANIAGSPGFLSESVKDFEAGYKGRISRALSTDLTVFYDRFCNIRSYVGAAPIFAFYPYPHLDATGHPGNGSQATGKGAEGAITWQVLPAWKLEGSYTYNIVNSRLSLSAPPESVDGTGKEPARNKWRLQSYINLSKSWKLDTFLYWTGPGSPTTISGPEIPVPAYTRLDLRLGYKAGPHWQLSLAGQNLLQGRHLEGLTELLTAYSYVNRGAYLKSTWQF